jgi:hypothetical protein
MSTEEDIERKASAFVLQQRSNSIDAEKYAVEALQELVRARAAIRAIQRRGTPIKHRVLLEKLYRLELLLERSELAMRFAKRSFESHATAWRNTFDPETRTEPENDEPTHLRLVNGGKP